MKEPSLVILAAGMGSRFGGLKQITAVDDKGHAIIDFSLYDAYRAGFRKVVFIIKHQIEEDFKNAVGRRMEKYSDVKYVYQELDKIPEDIEIPEGRVKPWGTGHAVLCCKDVIDGPFAVINADDFYGFSTYQTLYDFLTTDEDQSVHSMVAYEVRNTVTENGGVARGICKVEDGYMTAITETFNIIKDGDNAAYPDADGNMVALAGTTPVSMNCWGLKESFLTELEERFPVWLRKSIPVNPLKCEYFLPLIAEAIIEDGKACFKALHSADAWYGVTFKEDLPGVVEAIKKMRAEGRYPEALLD